jgi:hypothetical protein
MHRQQQGRLTRDVTAKLLGRGEAFSFMLW